MRLGYARVSAQHQNLDRQLATLKAAGCKRIFKEKESGREGVKRPQLEKAIEALGHGDVLVLAEWDRATRSMLDGIRIIERVAARGATLKALDRQWLDLSRPSIRADSASEPRDLGHCRLASAGRVEADRVPAAAVLDVAAIFLEAERPVGAREHIHAAACVGRLDRSE